MLQLPPQGLHVAVPAVHLAEKIPHGLQRLGLAAVPGDLAPVPAGRVEHAVRALSAGAFQHLAPQDGQFLWRVDQQLSTVAVDSVQLDHHIAAHRHILPGLQI